MEKYCFSYCLLYSRTECIIKDGVVWKFYPRSFGFAFVGFVHMFILLLRIFFSFFPGIAAVLGFTSICISIVSVDRFYK